MNYLSKTPSKFLQLTLNICTFSLILYLCITAVSFFQTRDLVAGYNSFFTYQKLWLVGSSAAIFIYIPLWQAIYVQLNLNRLNKISIIAVYLAIFAAIFLQSRTGVIIVTISILFSIFSQLSISQLIIKRVLLPTFAILASLLFVYNFTAVSIYGQKGIGNDINNLSQLALSVTGLSKSSLGSNEDRLFQLPATVSYSLSSPTEFLIGRGWYVSRFAFKPFAKQGNPNVSLTDPNPLSINAFTALLGDLGIIGFILYSGLYLLFITHILRQRLRFKHKLFFISTTLINYMLIFVGYPLGLSGYYLLPIVPGISSILASNLVVNNKVSFDD